MTGPACGGGIYADHEVARAGAGMGEEVCWYQDIKWL